MRLEAAKTAFDLAKETCADFGTGENPVTLA